MLSKSYGYPTSSLIQEHPQNLERIEIQHTLENENTYSNIHCVFNNSVAMPVQRTKTDQ